MTTNVVTVNETANFSEIADIFFLRKITSAPVVNKVKNIKGIISHYDLLYRLFPPPEEFYTDPNYFRYKDWHTSKRDLNNLRAVDIMTTKVITVNPDDEIRKACSVMVINHLRRLPVEDNSKLLGVVYSKVLTNILFNS